MPRLPDPLSLGTRPTPRPTRGVPNITSVGTALTRAADIGAASAAEGTGVDVLGKSISRVSDDIAKLEVRIKKRTDAVARDRAIGLYD